MNKEMLQRMKMAGEYQRKTIRALFPEEMGKHLDVIETEIKMMVMEIITEVEKNHNNNDACRDGQSYGQTSKVKKDDIM